MKPKIKALKVHLCDDGYYFEGFSDYPYSRQKNHFAFPADDESYDAMVEQMAESLSRFSRYVWKNVHPDIREDFRVQVRTVLKSIGITHPKNPSQVGGVNE